MLSAKERHQQIMEILKKQGYASVKEICAELYFSEATIRRDLEKMEHESLIQRVRGGALPNNGPNVEAPLVVRHMENRPDKTRIAKKAAELVTDNDILMLDASSTLLYLPPFLKSKYNLTIITNGLLTASTIVAEQLSCELFVTGGYLRENSVSSLVGMLAKLGIEQKHALKLFFSVRAIDLRTGLTDMTEKEAELKKVMLDHTDTSYLLADVSKFGESSFCRICNLSDIDYIITNASPIFDKPEWRDYQDKLIFAD